MRFRDLPIRRKLLLMSVASSAAALTLAGGGFLVLDYVQSRTEIASDLAMQSRLLAENSAAAITFDDARAAGETLAALGLRPRVVMACVYTGSGRLFATYHRAPDTSCPAAPPAATTFGKDDFTLVTPVAFEGTRLGTLYIHRELGDVWARLRVGALTVGGLLLAAALTGLLIARRMQLAVARPLLELAGTARAISQTRNYSLRATPHSNDEVGVVVYAFNDMLDRIAERNAELSRANADLENEVVERRRIEAERLVLLERERDANRVKDEFLATLSHELRTPLNAVLGWTRILRSTTPDPDRVRRALESIERNARAQARLVEDLLEISRIVTGKLRLQIAPCDLASILDSAVDVVQPAAAAKRIRLHADVRVRPAMTSGDPDRLQQVIWNLLSNAVKFTPPDGDVTARLERANGYRVTVTDTGMGIDPRFLPHVFEPFRQADGSSSREHGGLGLGLAIVRRIAEMHGGTVEARSGGPGEGASFVVHLPSELPVGDVVVPRSIQATVQPPVAIDPGLLAGIHILVVDDEEDARELLRTTFDQFGARVETVADAASALARFDDARPPDVLVSDIGMPVEDGYTLIRHLRERPAHRGGQVPAIAITAYASPTDRVAALAAGFHAHIAKPYEPADIAELVARLARGAHS